MQVSHSLMNSVEAKKPVATSMGALVAGLITINLLRIDDGLVDD